MPEVERTASTPAAGAGRQGVRIAIAAVIVKALATVMPEEMIPQVEVIVLTLITMAAAALGKLARDKDIPFLGKLI